MAVAEYWVEIDIRRHYHLWLDMSYNTGVSERVNEDIEQWLIERRYEYEVKAQWQKDQDISEDPRVYLVFTDPRAATLFKLTWC